MDKWIWPLNNEDEKRVDHVLAKHGVTNPSFIYELKVLIMELAEEAEGKGADSIDTSYYS